MNSSQFDAIIIGAGIAGASLAYFLTRQGMGRVLILEKEEQPGYHATGRSAATLVEFDPMPSWLQLKVQGGRFFHDPPPGFSENPLLTPSGILLLFHGEEWNAVQSTISDLTGAGVALQTLSAREATAIVPAIDPGSLDGAIHLTRDGKLDVHELLWSYLRHAKGKGAVLQTSETVTGMVVDRNRVVGVQTAQGEHRAPWVINAAGPWAGQIRSLLGPSPCQMTPYRRTIITFAAPENMPCEHWPFTAHLSRHLYFAPEPGGLLASPMDQDPQEPCDIRPDDWQPAMAVERLKEVAPVLVPRSILYKWAGLRTFAPDHAMVVGEDPQFKGFFWLAGQGGAGIETSPAVGEMAADLLLKGSSDNPLAPAFSPERFME